MSSDHIPDLIKDSIVTKEKHEEAVKLFLQKSDGIIILKTPENDTKLIEELLEIPEPLGDTFIKVPKEAKHCTFCGRQYSALDITSAGINVHGKQLIRDMITGKYGYIWNRIIPTGITCYDCKERKAISGTGYWFLVYSCLRD